MAQLFGDHKEKYLMDALRLNDVYRFEKAAAWFLAAMFCLVVNYVFGRDLSWDSINYHYYVGHAYWHDRAAQDFFPSGSVGYTNPLMYVPFFLMVWSDWHTIAVASVLALIHSLNISLLYLIGGELLGWGKEQFKERILVLVLSIAFLPFLQLIGASHGDLIQTIFQLLAVYLLLRATSATSLLFWGGSAFFMGFAAGLKLSGLIFCVGYALFTVVYMYFNYGLWKCIKLLLVCGLAGVLGFLTSAGSWMLQMWAQFGNPLFPHFNGIFKSPYYPFEGYLDGRFRIESIKELALFPLKMALPLRWLYFEKIAPDFRIAPLMVLSMPFVYLGTRTFVMTKKPSRELLFVLSYVTMFILWAFSSGNVRYGYLLFFLAGPLLYLLLKSLFGRSAACTVSLILVIMQGVVINSVGLERIAKDLWTDDWFGFDVPETHQKKAHLYLTGDRLSYSFLVKDVNPGSVFVNIRSGLPVDNAAVEARMDGLAEKFSGQTVALFKTPTDSLSNPGFTEMAGAYAISYSKFGYTMDVDGCELIPSFVYSKADDNDQFYKYLASCPLSYSKATAEQQKEHLYPIDALFNKIRRFCPGWFPGFGMPINSWGTTIAKYFPGQGVTLWANSKAEIYYDKEMTMSRYYLGTVESLGKAEKDDRECELLEEGN